MRRTTEDFFFSVSERKGMAVTGLAASAMGLMGVGIALMGESADTHEEADLVEFEVEGEPVQAFLWFSPFEEGDEVEVVAEKMGDVWKAFGIARPADRIIALHPHLSRGSKAHWGMVRKWWLWVSVVVWVFTCLVLWCVSLFQGFDVFNILKFLILAGGGGGVGFFIISGIIAWSVGRRYHSFVEMAEIVFKRLGWRDVENIDLPAKSRRLRRPEDPDELGFTYFRY